MKLKYILFCCFFSFIFLPIQSIHASDWDGDGIDEDYCFGYANYGTTSNPFTPNHGAYSTQDIAFGYPDPDYIMSTELFGKDIMMQIGEGTAESVARAYFFENISSLTFSETTSINGVGIDILGSLTDLHFSITADNQITLEIDTIIQVAAHNSAGFYTLTGTTTFNSDLILESSSGGDPTAIILDSTSLSGTTANLSINGTIVGIDTSTMESYINSKLQTYLAGIRIPVSADLSYFSQFVDPSLGLSFSDLGVKIVHDTYLLGNDPFIMVGMNVYSGAASSIEDTVFDDFKHNVILDDGLATTTLPSAYFSGDNEATNIIIAVTPNTVHDLIGNSIDNQIPYSSGGVSVTSYNYPTWAYHTADCPNYLDCDNYLHACELLPMGSSFGLGIDGTYNGTSFNLVLNNTYDVEKLSGHYYLTMDANVTSINLPWWVSIINGLAELINLGFLDEAYNNVFTQVDTFASNSAVNLEYVATDGSVQSWFHTLRSNPYSRYSSGLATGFLDEVFAGYIDTPNSASYTKDSDGDGISDIVESRLLSTDPNSSDSDGDSLDDHAEVYGYGSNPSIGDTDSDGLTDGDEVNNYGTSPLLADTDSDAIVDGDELVNGLDPLDPTDASQDNDADGLTNAQEINDYDTDLNDADTDADNLSDGDEVNVYTSDPLDADTDDDTLLDGEEAHTYGTDLLSPDTDNDELSDGEEVHTYQTNPLDADTDDDNLTDGDEIKNYGTDPFNPDTDGDTLLDGDEVHTYQTNPLDADTDDDNLTDGEEVLTYTTDPVNPDSDGDTLLDGDEVHIYGTDPKDADTDNDNLDDAYEVNTIYQYNPYKTDPLDFDTDNDEWGDGDEVYAALTKEPLIVDDLVTVKRGHDFAGNGYGDLIAFYPDGRFKIIGANGSEFINAGDWISGVGTYRSVPLVGDFNGDSKDDVAAWDANDSSITVALSDGHSFSANGIWISTFGANAVWKLAGDFNGDNKEDIFADGEVALSSGSSFSDNGLWISSFGSSTTNVIAGDFNGDGFDDLANCDLTTGNWQVALSNGASFDTPTDWVISLGEGSDEIFSGDFDANGQDDVFAYKRSTGEWTLGLSLGDSFVDKGIVEDHFGLSSTQRAVGDFDGDCKIDITAFTPGSGNPAFPEGTWEVSRSNSTYFESLGYWNLTQGNLPAAGGCDGSNSGDRNDRHYLLKLIYKIYDFIHPMKDETAPAPTKEQLTIPKINNIKIEK